MQVREYVKRRIQDFRKGMGMWKWSIFFSYFRRKMWNFITVDRFENIVREKKKRGGGSKSVTDQVLQSI